MMPQQRAANPLSSPFQGPGLAARVGPFALVAVVAQASLALPPGTHAWTEVTVSLVLLALVPLAFLLPWSLLPAWTTVLIPLVYTGSALALTLAAGTISGVGVVVLIPLIWTALFHHRWESACVVAAIVGVEIVVSVVQSAPAAVTIRRVLLWGALSALLAVAAHGLRDRIRRSQQETARLQERIGELMVVEDRDRLAADLQSSVVQRIFAAGLKLQGVVSLTGQAEVRRRVESSVTDLDDAIRLVRQAIFGLEHRLRGAGLRWQVLQLCADQSPVPEVSFTGFVNEVIPAEDTDELLGMLRLALGALGAGAVQTFIEVEAGESLSVIVTGTGQGLRPADGDAAGDLSALRQRASRVGAGLAVEVVTGGIRLAWHHRLPARAQAAG